MVEQSANSIPGRGGATLVHIGTSDDKHQLLLVFGASREQQFDDFWTIDIDRKNFTAVSAKKHEIKERDDFTTRNSMAGVVHNGRAIFYGGQNSEVGVMYDDLYTLETATMSLKQHQYKEGEVKPVVRNSHTLVRDGDFAYLFGGATPTGPLKDLYKLDLVNLKFSVIKIIGEGPSTKLPALEMHTSHVLHQDGRKKLLVLGGRGIHSGQAPEEATFHNQIFSIDLTEDAQLGTIEVLGTLPADLASH